MALSLLGWVNGVSASGIVIFGCALGLFMIYEAKKTKARLLFHMGLLFFFSSLLWLNGLVDFLTILLTGNNLDNSYGMVVILPFIWLPLVVLLAMYVGAELLLPDKKWYIVSIYLVLGVFFELFLFLDTMGSFTFSYPSPSGSDLIDEIIIIASPLGIIFAIYVLSIISFFVFGCFIKSIQSTGVIRKKFLLLSISFLMWVLCGVLDASITQEIILVFARIGVLSCFWLMYLGIREEPEKIKKVPSKKEVQVEGDLFRISKRPDQITEEEVSISKEKKICIVCKGKVGGFNIFVCTNCDLLYCQKCAKALAQLENICWVCNTPIDESKSVKPYKEEEERAVIEDEIPKKVKRNKILKHQKPSNRLA